MPAGISTLSLLAVGLYCLVVLSCIVGFLTASGRRQQAWHVRSWALIALFFVGLALLRFFEVEANLQDELRASLRSQGAYGERREFQRPLVVGVVVIAVVAGFWWFYRTARAIRGRRNIAVLLALASCMGMTLLIILRLISLSPIDRLLYGPIKLNWVGDIGASFLVIGAGLYYAMVVTRSRRH